MWHRGQICRLHSSQLFWIYRSESAKPDHLKGDAILKLRHKMCLLQPAEETPNIVFVFNNKPDDMPAIKSLGSWCDIMLDELEKY